MLIRVVVLLVSASLSLPVLGQSSRVELAPDLFVEPLASGVWLHVSSLEVKGWGLVPANGLVVVSEGEAALIDTPWTDEQTRLLAKWLADEHGAALTIAVPTHFHEDCLGGLGAAHELGAASYASETTIALAKKAGSVTPENGFKGRLDLSVGDFVVALEEVGKGHTVDNFVAWIPGPNVVFGGCLVKAAESKGMGNTADADIDEWPRTIDRVGSRFPGARIIVPGHGKPGGSELLDRTKELIEEYVAARR
jgi:metallo-beta-lactamase class B